MSNLAATVCETLQQQQQQVNRRAGRETHGPQHTILTLVLWELFICFLYKSDFLINSLHCTRNFASFNTLCRLDRCFEETCAVPGERYSDVLLRARTYCLLCRSLDIFWILSFWKRSQYTHKMRVMVIDEMSFHFSSFCYSVWTSASYLHHIHIRECSELLSCFANYLFVAPSTFTLALKRGLLGKSWVLHRNQVKPATHWRKLSMITHKTVCQSKIQKVYDWLFGRS